LEPEGYLHLFPLLVQWSLISSPLILMCLLFISAFISGSEVAFFSLNSNQLKAFEVEDSPTSRRIIHVREKPRRLLATLLITSNLINIGIVLLSYSI